MNTKIYSTLITLFISYCSFAQTSSKSSQTFSEPILTDSNSTVIIPISYNTGIFNSSKIGLWGNYYTNIIFYNFKTDTYKNLFDKETFIIGFNDNQYNYNNNKVVYKNITSKSIFYKVKNIDFDNNKKIEDKDPTILYISDLQGNNLKRITAENENVVSFDIFEKQNFALIKIQKDSDNNKLFDYKDSEIYYIKLDLNTLILGNKIEIKQ